MGTILFGSSSRIQIPPLVNGKIASYLIMPSKFSILAPYFIRNIFYEALEANVKSENIKIQNCNWKI